MSYRIHSEKSQLSPSTILTDDDFKALLIYFDRSWSGYRKVRKGVIRRVRQHMAILQCNTVEQYMNRLEQEQELRAACESLFNVTISRFFRDRQLWLSLREYFLPQLAQQFPAPINTWSAGCACGEEPYSLSILWSTLSLQGLPNILATDAQEICLERAQTGHYKKSSLKEVPVNLLASCFEPVRETGEFAINTHFKKTIRWQQIDLLDSLPKETFHLIFLRNSVLTYFQGTKKEITFNKIIQQLKPDGYLVIGSHEQLPTHSLPLARSDQCHMVFRRTVIN